MMWHYLNSFKIQKGKKIKELKIIKKMLRQIIRESCKNLIIKN